MNRMHAKNSKRVYSTDPRNQPCPRCGDAPCVCDEVLCPPAEQSTVKIYLDRKARRGKSVTIIEGIAANPGFIEEIARTLKHQLGTGGTAKQGRIEIQGDFCIKIAAILQEMGYETRVHGR